jgi:hypothetical protein
MGIKLICTADEIVIERMELAEETAAIQAILEDMKEAPNHIKGTFGFVFLHTILTDRLEHNKECLAAFNN